MTQRPTPSFSFLATSVAFTSLLFSFAFSPQAAFAKQAHDTAGTGYAGSAEYAAGSNTSANYAAITTLPEFERYDSKNRWQGVKAIDALAELKKFNGIKGSPAMRAIWRDLLLSDMSGMRFDNANEQTDVMAERLRILNQLGFFDEAVRLYQQSAAKRPVPEKIVTQAIDSLALSGSADGACLETMMAAHDLSSPSWTQDAALCALYFGDTKKAQQLYHKAKGGVFGTIYKMLESDGYKAIKADIPALWRTLLLAKGAVVTEGALRKASPSVLASIAVNPHVALATRLSAASRAADAGTVGFERLRKLYEMKHPTDAGVSDIVAAIEADEYDSLPQSDLYAAARFTFEGNARARVVKAGTDGLRPRTNVKSHVYGWIVDKLTLQPERIKWFAPNGYTLMMATNRAASAKIYYDAGHLESSSVAIIEALEEGKAWKPAGQKLWKKAMNDRFGSNADKKTAAAIALLKAYDSDNRLALLTGKTTSTDASKPLNLLKDSVQKGGRGLTLITALNRLATVPQASQLSTDELSEIMSVFANEGLYGPRKKIMLEILLQSVL